MILIPRGGRKWVRSFFGSGIVSLTIVRIPYAKLKSEEQFGKIFQRALRSGQNWLCTVQCTTVAAPPQSKSQTHFSQYTCTPPDQISYRSSTHPSTVHNKTRLIHITVNWLTVSIVTWPTTLCVLIQCSVHNDVYESVRSEGDCAPLPPHNTPGFLLPFRSSCLCLLPQTWPGTTVFKAGPPYREEPHGIWGCPSSARSSSIRLHF